MDAIVQLLTNRAQSRATRMVHFPGGANEQDIPLPMPRGGQVDPNLQQPDVLGAMGKAAQGYRSLSNMMQTIGRAQDRR